MNATLANHVRAAWLAPWRATSRQALWTSVSALLLLTLAALGIGAALPGRIAVLLALASYAFGLYFWWQFCMASLVVLARDARIAAVPGVAGNAVASVALYATISILPPMLVAGLFAHAAGLAALVCVLAAASALTLAFLPRITGMLIGLLPIGYVWLHNLHRAPSPFDPRVQTWGWILVITLVLLSVVRWRQLLIGDALDDTSRSGPMLASLRMQAARGNSVLLDGGWWTRARKPRAARIQLKHIGPHSPVKAIRIGLSGWLAPQTPAGRLARLGSALLVVPFMALTMLPGLAMSPHHVNVSRALAMAVGAGLTWLVFFAAVMTPFFIIGLLQRRWTRGGELALLALLPGLGHNPRAARSVACATLALPMAIYGCGLVATLTLGLALHATALVILLGALFFIGFALGTAWAALRILGGRPFSTIPTIIGVVVGCIGISACLSAAGMAANRDAPTDLLVGAEALTWLVAILCVASAWAAWRGWLRFRTRPHPFLANAQ